MKDVHIEIVDISLSSTCPGSLCRGLYGAKKCPCVSTTSMARTALTLAVNLQDEHLEINLQDFTSRTLTDKLIDLDMLESIAKTNDRTTIHNFIDHAETELEKATYNILGWWKASTIDDAALAVPKGHIVDLLPTSSYQLKKFVQAQPDDSQQQQQQQQPQQQQQQQPQQQQQRQQPQQQQPQPDNSDDNDSQNDSDDKDAQN